MRQRRHFFWRWLPLLILIVLLLSFFYFRLYRFLTFSQLQMHREFLTHWTQQHAILTALLFLLIYIVIVAISIPGASILTLTAGFLFGITLGTIYVVVAASIGASILFIAVKTSLGNVLAQRHTQWLTKLEQGFQKNAFNYLLFLRFIPIFPFLVINIAAGLLNVRLRTFLLATFIGIIPGSFVYTAVGNGLGTILDSGKEPNLNIIFSAPVLLPLLALAMLSIIPIIYKRIRTKKDA